MEEGNPVKASCYTQGRVRTWGISGAGLGRLARPCSKLVGVARLSKARGLSQIGIKVKHTHQIHASNPHTYQKSRSQWDGPTIRQSLISPAVKSRSWVEGTMPQSNNSSYMNEFKKLSYSSNSINSQSHV